MIDNIDIWGPERLKAADFNRHLLETLLNQMPMGVLVVEAETGKPLWSNQRMREIWHVQELPDPTEWIGFRPDGTPYEAGDWPLASALSSAKPIHDEDVEVRRRDGTRCIVRMNAAPIVDEGGNSVAAVLTCVDVSEHRQSFTSRRFLADASSILASSLDYVSSLRKLANLAVPTLADWCIVDLLDNAGDIERVAVENADPRIARAALQFTRLNPPNLSTEAAVQRVVSTGTPELIPDLAPDQISELTRSPRQARMLQGLGVTSAMIVPLVGHESPLGVLSFLAAGSNRRFGLEDLEIAKEVCARASLVIENSRLFHQSRAATEAKADFLAVMSHELRTPLTAVIGYAELLQLGVPDPVTPRQREQAERIEVSARHLLQLLEEILMLVTLESGERRVQREEVDVNKLLRRAASIVEPVARSKGLPLEVTLAAGHPVIRSDADKLLQILLNLLSNAVKFTESGPIGLRAESDDDSVTFEVTDSGIGVEPDHLKQIFEPFWQVERPITRRAGGTGLGLTITRRLAELLGAEVDLKSVSGQGSTFRVRLSLQPSDGAQSNPVLTQDS